MNIHISSDSVELNPVTKEDLSMVNLWYRQVDAFGYATGGKNPEALLSEEHNGLNSFVLGISPAGKENCIGLVAGELKSFREPVLWVRTFLIDTGYQRRHYGTKAFSLLSEYAFKRFNVRKVFVSVSVKNHTGALFWKSLGFRCVRLFSGSAGKSSAVFIFEKIMR